MTSKEYELIKDMLKRQEKLDKSIMSAYGLKKITDDKLAFAILDEVGELTHELKGDWCWWKKTQHPVDMGKVLGELVDIWHFVLSYQNNINLGEMPLYEFEKEKGEANGLLEQMRAKSYKLPYALVDIASCCHHALEILIAVTEYLGFTIEQVYEAYCGKNKINYQRLKEGY